MGRYTPLLNYLSGSEGDSTDLTFSELEKILGRTLPESAKKYPAFWSRGNHLGKLLESRQWKVTFRPSSNCVSFHRFNRDFTNVVPDRLDYPSKQSSPDLVLIGCVKQKKEGRYPAAELFISTLFRGRAMYARSTGKPWYVLSAKHGLLAPDDVIDTYDVSLKGQPAQSRAAWGHSVLQQIDQKIGSVKGMTVEIHAGSAYRDPVLIEGLEQRGATVTVPLSHLRQGEQLAWYTQPWTLQARQSVVYKRVKTRKQVPASTTTMPLSDLSEITRQITEDFMEGSLILTGKPNAPEYGWEGMPEILFARYLRSQGVTDVTVRIVLTLLMTMNRARDANRLNDSVANLFKTNPWAFDPEKIKSAGIDALRKVLIEAGVSQRHTMDVDAWHRVCMAMIDPKSPLPFRKVIFEGTGDYDELLTAINENREDGYAWFPLLSGPKISLVWIRCMAEPGGAAITGLEKMPVAVDVQVRKITEYLGVTSTYGQELNKARRPIQEAWHRAIKEVRGPTHLQGTGAALDPVLWFMGKWGCSFCERAGRKQPISRVCSSCRFEEVRAGTAGNTNDNSKHDGDRLIRNIAILLNQKTTAEIERVLSEFGLDTKLSAEMLRTAARTWLNNNDNSSR